MARCGYDGYPVPTGLYLDALYLNAIVSFAFFIIVIVQLIGILLGDKTPILVKELFYNLTVSYEPLLRKRQRLTERQTLNFGR